MALKASAMCWQPMASATSWSRKTRRRPFPVQHTLRDLLHTDHQFRLRAVFPVRGCDPMRPDTFLAIYENLQATGAAAPYLHVKMLTTRQDLDVPFGTLGPPPYSFNVSRR